MSQNHGANQLRKLVDDNPYVAAPGCATALEAQIAELTDNVAVYMSGASTNVSQFGYFDGLLGMAEMVENAGRLAAATELPVIADADTGYGGIHNVQRTVTEYDHAGVAAIQIEDQRWPKRCGHAPGKEVVSRDDAAARIRAAVDVRDENNLDILIVGRTDAFGSANADWSEHVERGRLFAEIGVDFIMPEMPDPTREHAMKFAEAIHDTHPGAQFLWNYSSNFTWTAQEDPLTFAELGDLGYRLIIVSLFGMHAATYALYEGMADFATEGERAQWRMEERFDGHETFDSAANILFDLGDFASYQQLEERYLEDARVRYQQSAGHGTE